MKQFRAAVIQFSLSLTLSASPAPATNAAQDCAEYFASETARLQANRLDNVKSLSDWQSARTEYRRQLAEMLGLWPMPERTDLKAVVTGTIEQEDFTVERLHFQAMPRLYVTANLYLPKNLENAAPAILYVCGHARVVTNGVSCGNKTGYQHHGAWFARNGYVALLIDTVQLGEIEGLHHGTYRENSWWWNARGYTPAGVEAWFGIRALDYLCSRPEVDPERIGMTGRSGGGSYTWTVAALDDRVKVAAPVAGMTDLQNQVVDGVVEGHCDCMFYLNTYQWDFPLNAALIAPRPLLIANSDKDTIFPLEGVLRLHEKVRGIYRLYDKPGNLGLLITEGPHQDTQDLQVPVFRWFNRFLKGDQPLIEMAAKRFFDPLQLRVFDKLPDDQVNTRIHEVFVPKASQPPGNCDELMAALRDKVFRAWPERDPAVEPVLAGRERAGDLEQRWYGLSVQPGVELRLLLLQSARVRTPERLILEIIDSSGYTNSPFSELWLGQNAQSALQDAASAMQAKKAALAFLFPRLVNPAEWPKDPRKSVHIRRRYNLLGQTLDSQRVWDIRCGIRALPMMEGFKNTPVWVKANGQMGVNAAYALLFEPQVQKADLKDLPDSHMEGPDYLNVLKICDIPDVLKIVGGQDMQ